MTLEQQTVGEREIRRFDYGDTTMFVSALDSTEATVEVVGDTLIVATDEREYDISLPEENATAFMKNGILTIEMRQ